MSTLIIPCVGRKIENGIPQYLMRHPNGKLLIERSIEGVYQKDYERILIVLLKEDALKYNATEVIKSEIKDYPVEVLLLDEMTSGPAETVYRAINQASVTGAVVVKDADNYLKLDVTPTSNFVAGLDLNTWERDVHNLRNKSFLILNEQKNLLDIIEKQVRSDVICLGLYGFKRAEDFLKAYEHLNDASYPIAKLYVSHIISYLIGRYGKVFHYIEAKEYENWGSDRLWKDMQRDYTLYFIDVDHVLSADGQLSDSNKEKLALLQRRGASFIGYTVHDEGYKNTALQVLMDAGLKFIKIVYGCPYSISKEIIDSEESLTNKVIEL
ncbi:MAG: hypothetical protein J5993_02225 [Clostridia bacterium]|nr:hypothetical protein [Clostridia bacterium]